MVRLTRWDDPAGKVAETATAIAMPTISLSPWIGAFANHRSKTSAVVMNATASIATTPTNATRWVTARQRLSRAPSKIRAARSRPSSAPPDGSHFGAKRFEHLRAVGRGLRPFLAERLQCSLPLPLLFGGER